MGQRRRDICVGVPQRKNFWTLRSSRGNICRRSATVERNTRKIKDLNDIPSVTRTDVLDAARRISGLVERTPLIEGSIAGQRVFLKCESLQTGGAFKLRGAT